MVPVVHGLPFFPFVVVDERTDVGDAVSEEPGAALVSNRFLTVQICHVGSKVTFDVGRCIAIWIFEIVALRRDGDIDVVASCGVDDCRFEAPGIESCLGRMIRSSLLDMLAR